MRITGATAAIVAATAALANFSGLMNEPTVNGKWVAIGLAVVIGITVAWGAYLLFAVGQTAK